MGRFNSEYFLCAIDSLFIRFPILGDIYLWKLVFIRWDRLILFVSFLKYARSKIWKYDEEKENNDNEVFMLINIKRKRFFQILLEIIIPSKFIILLNKFLSAIRL